MLALNTIPPIFFLLYGGLLADRMSRSTLLLAGRVGSGTGQAVVAGLVFTGHASIPALAALAFVLGSLSAVTKPAANGIVRQLVSPGQLQRANVAMRLPTNMIRMIGPAAAGIVVGLTSPAWALSWDAVTWFVSAGLLAGVRLDAPMRVRASMFSDLRAGLREACQRRWFWTYCLAGAFVVVMWRVGFELLGPVVSSESYHGARSWGIIASAFAVGLVVGGFCSLRWRPRRLLVVCIAASGGLALPLVLMAVTAPLAVVAGGTVIAAVLLDIAIVAWSAVMGQHLDDDIQGRLSAINSLAETAAVPLGYLAVALAGTFLSPQRVAIAAAVVIVVATVANLLVADVWHITRKA